MPFALIFIGIIFMVAAVRGTHKELFELLREDFTGSDNFFVWVLAVIFLVAIGNVEKLRPVSNAFLVLVILVILVGNGKRGLFDNFISQVRAGTGGGGGAITSASPGPADIVSSIKGTGDTVRQIASGALIKEAQKRIGDVGSALNIAGFLK